MSEKRQAALDEIEAAINAPLPADAPGGDDQQQEPEQDLQANDSQSELEETITESDKTPEEKKEGQQEQQEQSPAVNLERAKEAIANGYRDVSSALERVSTPGTLLLPIGILLILYFLIIPVNGQPRIAWLWLVITGNATLGGVGAGGSFGPTPGGGNTGGPPQGNATPNTQDQQQPGQALGAVGNGSTYSGHIEEEF